MFKYLFVLALLVLFVLVCRLLYQFHKKEQNREPSALAALFIGAVIAFLTLVQYTSLQRQILVGSVKALAQNQSDEDSGLMMKLDLLESLEIIEDNLYGVFGEITVAQYVVIADALRRSGFYKRAEEYYKKALSPSIDESSGLDKATIYRKLGDLYYLWASRLPVDPLYAKIFRQNLKYADSSFRTALALHNKQNDRHKTLNDVYINAVTTYAWHLCIERTMKLIKDKRPAFIDNLRSVSQAKYISVNDLSAFLTKDLQEKHTITKNNLLKEIHLPDDARQQALHLAEYCILMLERQIIDNATIGKKISLDQLRTFISLYLPDFPEPACLAKAIRSSLSSAKNRPVTIELLKYVIETSKDLGERQVVFFGYNSENPGHYDRRRINKISKSGKKLFIIYTDMNRDRDNKQESLTNQRITQISKILNLNRSNPNNKPLIFKMAFCECSLAGNCDKAVSNWQNSQIKIFAK